MNKVKSLGFRYVIVGLSALITYLYLTNFSHAKKLADRNPREHSFEMAAYDQLLGIAEILLLIPVLYLLYGLFLYIYNRKNKKTCLVHKRSLLTSIVPVGLAIAATGLTNYYFVDDGGWAGLVLFIYYSIAIGVWVVLGLSIHFFTRTRKPVDVRKSSFWLQLSYIFFPLAVYLSVLLSLITIDDLTHVVADRQANTQYDTYYIQLSQLEVGEPMINIYPQDDAEPNRKFYHLTQTYDLKSQPLVRVNSDLRRLVTGQVISINTAQTVRTRLATSVLLQKLSTCVSNPFLLSVNYGSPDRPENPILFLIADGVIQGISRYSIISINPTDEHWRQTKVVNNFNYNQDILGVTENGTITTCGGELSEYLSKSFVSEVNELRLFPVDSCTYGRKNYFAYHRDDICPLRVTPKFSSEEYKNYKENFYSELIENLDKEGFLTAE